MKAKGKEKQSLSLNNYLWENLNFLEILYFVIQKLKKKNIEIITAVLWNDRAKPENFLVTIHVCNLNFHVTTQEGFYRNSFSW